MKKKLNEYFKLVEQSRQISEKGTTTELKAKMKEISRNIRKLSEKLADPNADFEPLLKQISEFKAEQKRLAEKLESAADYDKGAVKKKIVALRKEILGAKHTDNWDEVVAYFKKNPVALTSLIHQTGYDEHDPVKVLRSLPFRGRVSGPYAVRFDYDVVLEDGSKRSFGSVRKIILQLDQYKKRDIKSLALTYDALKRYAKQGRLTLDGLKVTDIVRKEKKS